MAAIGKIQVFVSYAKEDEDLFQELEKHLFLLRDQGIIETWHVGKLSPGQEIESETLKHLECAQLIILLLSVDYLNSYSCYKVQMARALERHAAGEISIIPITLRSADYVGTPFSDLQMFPTNSPPLAQQEIRDPIWAEISSKIRYITEKSLKFCQYEPSNRTFFQFNHSGNLKKFSGFVEKDRTLIVATFGLLAVAIFCLSFVLFVRRNPLDAELRIKIDNPNAVELIVTHTGNTFLVRINDKSGNQLGIITTNQEQLTSYCRWKFLQSKRSKALSAKLCSLPGKDDLSIPSKRGTSINITPKDTSHDRSLKLAQQLALDAARKAGVLDILRYSQENTLASVFGRDSAPSKSEYDVRGELDFNATFVGTGRSPLEKGDSGKITSEIQIPMRDKTYYKKIEALPYRKEVHCNSKMEIYCEDVFRKYTATEFSPSLEVCFNDQELEIGSELVILIEIDSISSKKTVRNLKSNLNNKISSCVTEKLSHFQWRQGKYKFDFTMKYYGDGPGTCRSLVCVY